MSAQRVTPVLRRRATVIIVERGVVDQMDRRTYLVPDALAAALVHALDDLARTHERVARIRQVGYDEVDLPYEAVSAVAPAWAAIRRYAAQRSVAGGLIVAVEVPGHPDDTPTGSDE